MLPEKYFRGFNFPIAGNEERFMLAMPLFQEQNKFYSVLSTPWSIQEDNNLQLVDISSWSGTKTELKNTIIRNNQLVLVFGNSYMEALERLSFDSDFERLIRIQNGFFIKLITPAYYDEVIPNFFKAILNQIDFAFDFDHSVDRLEKLFFILKGIPRQNDKESLEYRIRDIFFSSFLLTIHSQDKICIPSVNDHKTQNIILDLGLSEVHVHEKVCEYFEKRNNSKDRSKQNFTRVEGEAFDFVDLYPFIPQSCILENKPIEGRTV